MKRRVLLITGNSVPLPNAAQLAGEGDEIVRTRLKNRDNVNPLVPGSSPGGPTNFSNHTALSDVLNAQKSWKIPVFPAFSALKHITSYHRISLEVGALMGAHFV
jgi:hypothetical protein